MLEEPKRETLSGFVNCVSQIRKEWGIDEHKELWFRGEGKKHERSIVRPALYRPPKGDRAMKEIAQLLDIESELYEEFQRCGAQLLGVSNRSADNIDRATSRCGREFLRDFRPPWIDGGTTPN